MMRRFCSGSSTPASRARKRSRASTCTSGTWKWSPKARHHLLASFLRIRPWSTSTHVSRSPSARCTISAATEESTPPDRPQIARPSPDLLADQRDLLVDDRRRASTAPRSRRRRRGTCAAPALPCGVCTTSGWNWIPYRPRSTDSNAATGEAGEDASAVKPGGGSKTVSRWLIQQVCSAGRPASSRPGSLHLQLGAAELRHLGALDVPAELERHRLHPVTDAQHRDARARAAPAAAAARRRE